MAASFSSVASIPRRPSSHVDAFARWFADSVVVDAVGNPKILFHGPSQDLHFEEFSGDGLPGWFAEDRALAEVYAVHGVDTVIPVYLSIRKPFDLTSWFDLNDPLDTDKLIEILNSDQEEMDEFIEVWSKSNRMWGVVNTAGFRDWIGSLGFDGVKTIEGGSPVWAVLNPCRVKSATDNTGGYNPTSPRYRE
jgi:hypothetical protein